MAFLNISWLSGVITTNSETDSEMTQCFFKLLIVKSSLFFPHNPVFVMGERSRYNASQENIFISLTTLLKQMQADHRVCEKDGCSLLFRR